LVDIETRPPDTTVPPVDRQEPRPRRWRRALALILAIVAAVWVYAFAFDRVDVSLDEIQSETRQAQLFRILRALAQPDLVTFERDTVTFSAEVQVPCAPGTTPAAPTSGGPTLSMVPPCADPGSTVTIEGTGFEAGGTGIISFVPESEFDISLRLARFNVGDDGMFAVEVELPSRPSDEPQQIEASTSTRVGSLANFFNPFDAPQTVTSDDGEVRATPRWSENAILTWERIIETVMLALLATTAGTALAIPFSFLAARNLMRDIATPVLNLALTLIAIPVGLWVGVLGSRAARALSEPLTTSLWTELAALLLLPVVIRYLFRWAVPVGEIDPPSPGTRAVRGLVLLGTAVLGILFLIVLSQFMLGAGEGIQDNTGGLGFFGNFIEKNGEILDVVITVVSALIGAGVLAWLAGKLGYLLRSRLTRGVTRVLSVPLAATAGAVVAVGVGVVIDWFFQVESTAATFWIPAAIGALYGAAVAARAWHRESVGVGLSIYYMARTLFNTLRSIEPLVMVIVFVVWVGIGPFAGSLALALHTTAALAKLYSEQVESIMSGPIEAIRATGATRLQTIVYGVVPQIVPPYISFTMYRWDINVRMSTIIGFAGGGGIGFLLQQNINLLQYKAAAAQMLAIAIVVASMDYLSSRLRERVV
jgi:phosphonate ABC transporter permease subunit PhnE